MAPSNGKNVNQTNGFQPRVRSVLPALPLIVKFKKGVDSAEKKQNGVIAEPSMGAQDSERPVATPSNTDSSATSHTVVREVNGHSNHLTSSSFVLDESVSVQSSQDPSSAIDNDSSVSSAVTSEFVEPLVTSSHIESASVTKPDRSDDPHPETTISTANGLGATVKNQEANKNDEIESEEITPEVTATMLEPSPVSDIPTDQPPVELSGTSENMSKSRINTTAKPLLVPQMDLRTRPGRKQHNSYPEAMPNGHTANIVVQRSIDNQIDPATVNQPLPTVVDHLLYMSNTKQLADWLIQLNPPGPNMQPTITYAHSFVLWRSERIRKAMGTVRARGSALNIHLPVIHIHTAKKIIPHAFESALRFLYSDTVLAPEALFPRHTYMDRHARAHLVDYILSYWISGIELGLEPVSVRAHALLAGMIDWDVAELLVREAYLLRKAPPVVSDYQVPGEMAILAESILRLVFGLFIHRFNPEHFKVITDSHHIPTYSRLAQFDHTRSASNPILAGMVFGSMPSTTDASPTSAVNEASWSADTVASSIFLNLEFPDLNHLGAEFVRQYGTLGTQVMSDVVNEREKRRLHILNTKAVLNKDRDATPATWDVVGWREYFDQGKLNRELVEYVLPDQQIKNEHQEIKS